MNVSAKDCKVKSFCCIKLNCKTTYDIFLIPMGTPLPLANVHIHRNDTKSIDSFETVL